jgi:DNA-binding MarR family transcriptional regulator
MASGTKRSAESGRDDSLGAASELEAIALMRLLHFMDAASAGRDAMQLDLRARRVLQALGLAGPTPIVTVAQGLGISPSTMTGLADRLEREGYLRRRPHETDRRATVLELTAKGRRLFAHEKDFYRRLIDKTLAPLDERATRLILQALGRLPAPTESRDGRAG